MFYKSLSIFQSHYVCMDVIELSDKLRACACYSKNFSNRLSSDDLKILFSELEDKTLVLTKLFKDIFISQNNKMSPSKTSDFHMLLKTFLNVSFTIIKNVSDNLSGTGNKSVGFNPVSELEIDFKNISFLNQLKLNIFEALEILVNDELGKNWITHSEWIKVLFKNGQPRELSSSQLQARAERLHKAINRT